MSTFTVSCVVISKDERGLSDTLAGLKSQAADFVYDVWVVDASDGRLDPLKADWPGVRWMAFSPASSKAVTIPEQRNLGVRSSSGDVIAFIDAGCQPSATWLQELAGPIVQGLEDVTVGSTENRGSGSLYSPLAASETVTYVEEAPTINLAFSRTAFEAVRGFDEEFKYGSDIDFTWRMRDAGYLLRLVPAASISHDWGNRRRQVRRAFMYGEARARLYHKHFHRWRQIFRRDPLVVVYPLFLLALPLTVFRRFRFLPLLLAVPWWRGRRTNPWLTVMDHLAYGAGALSYVVSLTSTAGRASPP